jgi:hypothetical protein
MVFQPVFCAEESFEAEISQAANRSKDNSRSSILVDW